MEDKKSPQPNVSVNQEQSSPAEQETFEMNDSGSLINLPDQRADTEFTVKFVRSGPHANKVNKAVSKV